MTKEGRINVKNLCTELSLWGEEEINKPDHMLGVIFCEGEPKSIDPILYSYVYPDFLIIPIGGCSQVTRFLSKARIVLSEFGLYAYAITDRDSLTKNEMKKLYDKYGVYTTKLPFVENIICSPEVIRVVSYSKNQKPEVVIKKVSKELVKVLWQKFKEALPINTGIDKLETIKSLGIISSTKKKTIVKEVSEENILYTYRDKIIVNIVGNAFGMSRREYYEYIKELLGSEQYSDKLIKAASSFLPKLQQYEIF